MNKLNIIVGLFFLLLSSCGNNINSCDLNHKKLISYVENQGFYIRQVKKADDISDHKLMEVLRKYGFISKKFPIKDIRVEYYYFKAKTNENCFGNLRIQIYSSQNKNRLIKFYNAICELSKDSRLSFAYAKQLFTGIKFNNEIVIIQEHCDNHELNIDKLLIEIGCQQLKENIIYEDTF